ncbi:50S ribosomal protein L4 [Candidatus Atribacteria bacterium 1244-E10-H5-B2]|nr:MAG: 50S ribosomal protein L4 [Candidatus Atribacteria bacterium 1244-E10-H5-B2]
MIDLSVHNIKGENIGEVSLRDNIFNTKVNKYLVHQAVKRYLANRRRGTASTKNRSEVRGGGAKPWKQKGTGRARAGTSSSPIWVGGGIVFGPAPRNYSFSLPKKMKVAALKSALSDKLANKEIIIIDKLSLEENKTSKMVEILKNLQAFKKPLIITEKEDNIIALSVRNIKGAQVLPVSKINTYDLISHEKIIITKKALKRIEEVLI